MMVATERASSSFISIRQSSPLPSARSRRIVSTKATFRLAPMYNRPKAFPVGSLKRLSPGPYPKGLGNRVSYMRRHVEFTGIVAVTKRDLANVGPGYFAAFAISGEGTIHLILSHSEHGFLLSRLQSLERGLSFEFRVRSFQESVNRPRLFSENIKQF